MMSSTVLGSNTWEDEKGSGVRDNQVNSGLCQRYQWNLLSVIKANVHFTQTEHHSKQEAKRAAAKDSRSQLSTTERAGFATGGGGCFRRWWLQQQEMVVATECRSYGYKSIRDGGHSQQEMMERWW
jgi:hypothetical protein